MTEGNRQREQESKRAQYRPRRLEQDIFLPLPMPCYPKAYLAMWAILGRCSADQRALTCRDAWAWNIEFIGKVNYRPEARLRPHAAEAGV